MTKKATDDEIQLFMDGIGVTMFAASRLFDHKHGCFEWDHVGAVAAMEIMRFAYMFQPKTGVRFAPEFSRSEIRLYDERHGNYFWPKAQTPQAWYEALGLTTENGVIGFPDRKQVDAND